MQPHGDKQLVKVGFACTSCRSHLKSQIWASCFVTEHPRTLISDFLETSGDPADSTAFFCLSVTPSCCVSFTPSCTSPLTHTAYLWYTGCGLLYFPSAQLNNATGPSTLRPLIPSLSPSLSACVCLCMLCVSLPTRTNSLFLSHYLSMFLSLSPSTPYTPPHTHINTPHSLNFNPETSAHHPECPWHRSS